MNNPDRVLSSSPLTGLGRSWWVVALFGLLAIVFGATALFRPISMAAAMTWAIGILALAEGLVSLIALFDRSQPISKGWLLFYAVASIGFGVLTVLDPLAMASVILWFLAAWLIVGGVFRIVLAIRVRALIDNEWLLILSGLLAIVLGVLFALQPLAGIAVTTMWIGAVALVYGIFQVVVAFRLRGLA